MINRPPPPSGRPLCLGLHITKCAGTSLMTTLRRAMAEDEYYFFSSYHESWLASRPRFSDIVMPDRLRIVFGHFCHESLLRVFADRPLFLFTGLREPISCAISAFQQVNAVQAWSGREPVSAQSFLSGRSDPICREILRCFPSAASCANDRQSPELWRNALSALSLFDFLYTTERFAEDATVILERLNLSGSALMADNVSERRHLPANYRDFIDAECLIVRQDARDVLGGDLRLWRAIAPFLSRTDMRGELARQDWALDRASFTARLPDRSEAARIFGNLERDFMVHEFAELNRLEDLRAATRERIVMDTALLRRIGDYTH